MKNQKRKSSILSIAAVALCSGVIALTACKKDEVQTPSPAVKNGTSEVDMSQSNMFILGDLGDMVLKDASAFIEQEANKALGDVRDGLSEIHYQAVSIPVNVYNDDDDILTNVQSRTRWLAEIVQEANEIISQGSYKVYAIDILENPLAVDVSPNTVSMGAIIAYYDYTKTFKSGNPCAPFDPNTFYYADDMAKLLTNRYLDCNNKGISRVPNLNSKLQVAYFQSVNFFFFQPVDLNCDLSGYDGDIWRRTNNQLRLRGSVWNSYYNKIDSYTDIFFDGITKFPGRIQTFGVAYTSKVMERGPRGSGIYHEKNCSTTIFHRYTYTDGHIVVKPRILPDLLGL